MHSIPIGYIYVYIFNQELKSNLKLPRNILEKSDRKIEIWSIAMSLVFYNYVKECVVCDIWLFNIFCM